MRVFAAPSTPIDALSLFTLVNAALALTLFTPPPLCSQMCVPLFVHTCAPHCSHMCVPPFVHTCV